MKIKPAQQKTLIILTLLAAACIDILITVYIYLAFFLPLPDQLTSPQNLPTTKLYDRNGTMLYEVLNPEHGRKTYLELERIPQDFINATIASEDKEFWQHSGVDVPAIIRAAYFNVLETRITSGASTITQQLVRNLLGLNRERTLREKLLEAAYAIRISHHFSKEQVLEKYLNTVYYGSMSYGAQAAALNYFDHNLYDLDLAHLSFIAGLPQAPTRYNPYTNFKNAKARQQYVLRQMVAEGFISEQQADSAYDQPLTLRKNITTIQSPHFVHYVLNHLDQEYGPDLVNFGGLEVTTTLDLNLQNSAESIIDYRLSELEKHDVSNAALLAVNPSNSQVLAWVGSANFFNTDIDGQVDLVTSLRQPGSALKPLLYLLAFEKGYTPASILPDIPQNFQTSTGPYSPKNYDLSYHGPVRIRRALANSFNIPAVYLLDQIGIADFIFFLQSLGFESLNKSPDYYGLSVTLGGGEVRLYEMVRAYNTIANQGHYSDLQPLLEVKDSSAQILYKYNRPPHRNILGPKAEQHTYLLTDILSDSDARIESFGEGNVLELSFPAAVKTGTTRNFRDNWTVGFSPHLVTGVWVGNADASPMKNISGIDGAGPIWHDFMEQAHQNQKPTNFTRPPGIVDAQICYQSGKIANETCQRPLFEIFTRNNLPTESDDYYQNFDCLQPDGSNNQEIHLVYPLQYYVWAEQNNFLPPENCLPQAINSDYTASTPLQQAESVQLIYPIDGDAFQLDQNLPQASQKIPIKLTISHQVTNLVVEIDNTQVFPDQSGAQLSPGSLQIDWLPTAGEHQLRLKWQLENSKGVAEESIKFVVE